MGTIRKRSNGTFELRVTHRLLPKPYYTTHDTHEQANEYDVRLKASLDQGFVPPELMAPVAASKRVPLSLMLRQYLNEAPISATDRPMVKWLQDHITIAVQDVTVLWVDRWVRSMKKVEHLSPGTIRKRVESLARAIDWWNRREHPADAMPSNPLRTLPRGYSTYQEGEAPDGAEPKEDVERDRRLAPDEESRIEAAILGQKRDDRQRPLTMVDRDEFLLLWRLIVNTGLRLREAYRLRVRDVKFDLKTIHVPKSKTGKKRDIPMTKQAYAWLAEHKMPSDQDALVFSYWSGDDEDLDRATNKLSKRFSSVFEYANVVDLTEHDLRHEATCRWVLMKDDQGRWLFRTEECQKITGHKSAQQFQRYLSLRGSDLADRLW